MNTVLADVIKHVTPDRAFEDSYPQVMGLHLSFPYGWTLYSVKRACRVGRALRADTPGFEASLCPVLTVSLLCLGCLPCEMERHNRPLLRVLLGIK